MDEILDRWKTDSEKKEVVNDLNNLVQMKGWKIITELIEENIKELSESVLDPAEGMGEAEINRLRDKIKLQKNFCRLPNILIEGLTTTAIKKEVEFDPYE